MSQYILVCSRDPFTSGKTADFYHMAQTFRRDGHDVTLILVVNGVLAARARARCPSLLETIMAGVTVLAEDVSLRRRAMVAEELVSGVSLVGFERVLSGLVSGHKVFWH